MTRDEFERIVVAICAMRNFNISGVGILVPVKHVIHVLHSQLHEEDRVKYKVVEDPSGSCGINIVE